MKSPSRSRRSRSRRRSRTRSRRIKGKSSLNKFFDKIFVISLSDKDKRWEKVSKQFKKNKVDVERFIAIDGRCKTQGKKGCIEKLKTFEIIYDIKISNKFEKSLEELIPASSLTIGTILLLRQMVKNKWDYMLLCEDDILLTKDLEKKFKRGLSEIGDYKWDLLYLGCGNACGVNELSYEKNKNHKYLSTFSDAFGEEYYVKVKEDIRAPCDDLCPPFSDHISFTKRPGGTWCYAYSLKGAKKVLDFLDNDAGNHIDWMLMDAIREGNIKALAFDPPLAYHEEGYIRSDTDIPWTDE